MLVSVQTQAGEHVLCPCHMFSSPPRALKDRVLSCRSAFLAAHIPLFLYPFLHTVSKTRPFEYLRLTSLGVIGKHPLVP